MIPLIDSHCHAWETWPYKPPVPDPESRGRVEQLLHEMDVNGVDQAVIVCAQIERNPENNAYVAEQVARFPDRLHQLVDLDSVWSSTHHAPGAADRLRAMATRWPIKGFTHYFGRDDDGAWLMSDEGLALFQTAADLGLIASLSCYPYQHPAIRRVAERFPSVPILCHHLGHVRADEPAPYAMLKEVLASARVPNICHQAFRLRIRHRRQVELSVCRCAARRPCRIRALWLPADVLGFRLSRRAFLYDVPAGAGGLPHALRLYPRRR